MFQRTVPRLRLVMLFIVVLAIAIGMVAPAAAAPAYHPAPESALPAQSDLPPAMQAQDQSNPYLSVDTFALSDGKQLERTIIAGPPKPPPGYQLERTTAQALAGDVLLPVPAYSWVYGCSAVSASMIAAYFDRNGLPNIYTGPTNGGVMPMENSTATTGWPTWTDVNNDSYPGNPLTASRKGLDGRTPPGSIDDYWVYYGSNVTTNPDPYITNGWTQHTWGDAVGDYMWTSQSAKGNTDGATTFWGWGDSAKLTCATLEAGNYTDGTLGRKHFYEARGYTVSATECYNQKTDNKASGGFSFANYKAKIDAGYPVFLNLAGHSVVGLGYNDTTSPPTVYLNDTWSWTSGTTHAMPWGGSYSGMDLISVSVADPVLSPTTPTISIGDATVTEGNAGTTNATFAVSLSAASSSTVTVNWATAPGTAVANTDYATANGTLTFAPNVTSQTVTVQVIGDTAVEPNETFYVNLSNPAGATILDGQGIGTITNDDQAPLVTISINDVQVNEGNSGQTPASFTVSLSAASSSAVTVNWATANGTATRSSDYVGASGKVTFAPNVTSQSVTVQVIGDTAVEPNETFYVNLSNPSGATLADSQGVGTILNDDIAPVLHVGDLDRASSASSRNWTANVTITVHDATHRVVAGATVSALWTGSTRAVTCTTGSTGVCTLSKSGIAMQTASVQLTVQGVTKTGATYNKNANHDPEGDSNGSVITVTKP